jgi:integrase
MTSKPLSEVEINEILSNIDNKMHQCLFIVGLKTGFRISELLSLTVADITDTMITVHRRNMKGKQRSRSIPLHPLAKQYLKDYMSSLSLNPNDKLFKLSRTHAWLVLKMAARKAQVSGCVSTHSMRKTFGMKVYEKTEKNIVAAQKALGHKSLASTSHYLSVDQELVDNAILSD